MHTFSHLRNSITFLSSYSSHQWIGNEVFSDFTFSLHISRAHSTFHVLTPHFTCSLHISRAHSTFHVLTLHFTCSLHISRAHSTFHVLTPHFTNILPSSCFLMPYTTEPFSVFVHLSLIGMVNSAVAAFSRFIKYKLHSKFFPSILIFNKSTVLQSHISLLYRTVHCTYLCRLL